MIHNPNNRHTPLNITQGRNFFTKLNNKNFFRFCLCIKRMSNSTNCKRMSNFTNCRRMSNFTNCKRMSSFTKCTMVMSLDVQYQCILMFNINVSWCCISTSLRKFVNSMRKQFQTNVYRNVMPGLVFVEYSNIWSVWMQIFMVCIHICMHKCMLRHVHTWICRYPQRCIYTYTWTHGHMDTETCICMHKFDVFMHIIYPREFKKDLAMSHSSDLVSLWSVCMCMWYIYTACTCMRYAVYVCTFA